MFRMHNVLMTVCTCYSAMSVEMNVGSYRRVTHDTNPIAIFVGNKNQRLFTKLNVQIIFV